MGARLVKFNFKTKPNEQIEAVIKLPDEERSVIHGIVKNCRGQYVKDAVVKLLEVEQCSLTKCNVKPLTHTFTDECGQFLFGPLQPCKEYMIKIWYDDVKIRKIIFDDCCGPGKTGLDAEEVSILEATDTTAE